MKFTQHHKNLLIRQLTAALESVKTMPVAQGCESCLHASLGAGPIHCKLAFHAVVPPQVVEIGCEKYEMDPEDVPL